MRWVTHLSVLALSLCGVAYLVAFKSGQVEPRPPIFAGLMIALAACLVAELGYVGYAVGRQKVRPAAAAGRFALIAGVLVVIVAGTVNWLLSLQGYVILLEGETRQLGEGGQLEVLEVGPLGDPRELEVDLALVRVELEAAGAGTFNPVSIIETRHGDTGIERQAVGGGRGVPVGQLVLRQGTFGYAPRVVMTQADRTVFDRVVPFMTRRDGREGTSFAAEIELREEDLFLSGEILLDSLDERLQGHPMLHLVVHHGTMPLGSGDLRPGEFANLEEGYSVGFAGLEKWSEIDVARRTYRKPIVVGFWVAAAGLVVWPLAAWRGW